MLTTLPLVFLLDVDNTLLDNDRFAADLTAQLDRDFGKDERERYWSIYAGLRDTLGYADYLGALQQFRLDNTNEAALLQLSFFLLDYPFVERIYPHALDAIRYLETIGTSVILSDGDMVFQPRKIQRTGLWDAVAGRVLVYVHKERMIDATLQRYPAAHYVMVDDKPGLLAAVKRVLGGRVSTIFVRQGHYAAEAAQAAPDPTPDYTIDHISDLRGFAKADFPALATLHVARTRGDATTKAAPPE
ncbi:HAD family hydrolase [Dyella sp. ASV21]|uniref:HAD family hydrolase n=1 Tax=Dyella sp. ASV21 TaxID=2795114 RepID=UPI001E3AF17F|nr:HAD family hydrolase [Dyella sp. ASV21]